MKADAFGLVLAVSLTVGPLGWAQSGAGLVEQAAARRAEAERQLEKVRTEAERVRQEGLDAIAEARREREAADEARRRAERELEALQSRQKIPLTEQARRLDRRQRRLWGATRNTAAPPEDPDAFAEAVTAAFRERLEQLKSAAAVRRGTEPVMGRDGQVRPVPVLRVGAVLGVAGGDGPESTGFLVPSEDPDGLARVRGVPFPPELAQQARDAAAGGFMVPLDLDGTLARTDAPLARTFWDRLQAGGVFVWPILLVGFLGVVLSLERAWFFYRDRIPEVTLDRLLKQIRAGSWAPVVQWSEPAAKTGQRVVRDGVSVSDRSAREAVLETALLREEPSIQRGLGIIAACAGIAPLLGLLGTVTGMISTFDVITVYGTGNPRLLSGGISVALVTTQVGLVVAVPLVLLHAVLARVAQRKGGELEALRAALMEEEPPQASAEPAEPGRPGGPG